MGKNEEIVDQQRSRRIPYKVNVVMRSRDDVELVKGEVRDLSRGGMFIETVVPLKPGAVFDVEVPMNPLNYIGSVRVLWTRERHEGPERPFGMAVEWINLTDNQKRLLYRQIDDHVRRGGNVLVGNPTERTQKEPRTGSSTVHSGGMSSQTKMVIGLSIAVVVLVVVVVALL